MVARRLVPALVALLAVSGCAVGGAESVAAARPLVAVLRATPDPYQAAFVAELRAQRFPVGSGIELWPADGETVHADADAAVAALRSLDRPPALVVAYSTPFALAAVEALPDTPTVTVVNDPVASGLVDERDRPEGSVTGVTYASPADRTLALTARLFAGLDRIGYLAPEDDPAVAAHRDGIVAAARADGVEVVEATFADASQVEAAVDRLVDADVDAAVLASSNATVLAGDALHRATDAAQLPVVSNNARADFAVLVLEPDGAEVRRQVARQVARLLGGDPVSQVPVEDPRRFRVVLDHDRAVTFGAAGLDEELLRQVDDVR